MQTEPIGELIVTSSKFFQWGTTSSLELRTASCSVATPCRLFFLFEKTLLD
jgi:hypothetical protein